MYVKSVEMGKYVRRNVLKKQTGIKEIFSIWKFKKRMLWNLRTGNTVLVSKRDY